MKYDFEPVGSLLKMPQRPTALFVCSDFMALAVVRFIKEMGLRIPDDISVISFDNIELCNYLAEPLTTVGFSLEAMAAEAVGILEEFWASEGEIKARDVRIPARLMVRKSTARPKP